MVTAPIHQLLVLVEIHFLLRNSALALIDAGVVCRPTAFRAAHDARDRSLPIPLLQVDLADWIDDFDGTLARVLAFLDLPYDPACERFYEQDRLVRTASAAQVRQPVNARGIGRWRRFEPFIGEMLAELDS